MAEEVMAWSDLRGKPVFLARQGRQAGTIEDFYYEPGTQSVNALRVNSGLGGYRILLASAIDTIEDEGVTIADENMLIAEANAGPVYQLPLGDHLLGFTITTQDGRTIGAVRDLFLGIYPPVALRLSSFKLDNSRIPVYTIAHFGEKSLILE